jgi:hypothetical protein
MERGIVFLMNVAVSACETVARYSKFEAMCDQLVQRFLFETDFKCLESDRSGKYPRDTAMSGRPTKESIHPRGNDCGANNV